MQIKKRDNSIEEFDVNKIINAVDKAFKQCGYDGISVYFDRLIRLYAGKLSMDGIKSTTVEEIQDWVEKNLMGFDLRITTQGLINDEEGHIEHYEYKDVAKAYILYRDKHRLQREIKNNNKYYQTILELVSGKSNDTSKENANKDASQLYVIRDLIAGETSKKLYKELFLSKQLREMHDRGIIHIHDCDYRIQQYITNCELNNLKDCLQNGTVINGKLIRKPHSLRTACTVASQIITAVSSSTYGGQTITMTHLAPFVRESKNNLAKKLKGHEELIDSFLQEEITNSVQTLLYQLNTMATTNGQSPFITLFLYPQEDMEYINETLMLCEEVLKQRIEGMESPAGQRINPTFPKLVVCLTEDMFTEKRMKDYAYLCAQCVVKRMVPDFISEKNIKDIKEGCVIPPMGCRSFLHPWKNENGNYQVYGRGNIGVISINLPYLALESKNFPAFLNRIDEVIDIISAEQKRVYNVISSGSIERAPILYKYGVFARKKEGTIEDIIGNMKFSASIGYMGIAECVEKFGIHYNSKNGHDVGIRIIKSMYERANYNKEKYGIALSLYGTPAENTVTKFANALKDFPIIKNVNDRDYITNSYHIQVTEKINAFDKIDFESEFQKYSTGGAISYIEAPDIKNNPEVILELMKHIYDKMVYCEINTKSCSCCYKCGYEGELIYKEDGTFECPNCGNTDPTNLYAIYRVCGYLGSFQNGTSKGRQADIQNRVEHLSYEVSED